MVVRIVIDQLLKQVAVDRVHLRVDDIRSD
jgi:hypothetical protein